jgi:homoserine kinase
MNKLLTALLLATVAASATADPYHYHYHNDWVGPALIGGMIGYSMHAAQPQVIVQQVPVYPAYRQAEPVYQEVFEYDANCNCYYKRVKQVGWR